MASEKMRKDRTDEKKLSWKQSIIVYLHDLIYLLMIIMLVFLVFFRVIVVSGSSMYSTLWDGDYLLLLSNFFYHEPQYGDIVVISKDSFDNGHPIVKRVIATEGQTVNIDFSSGTVYVDEIPLKEEYIYTPTTMNSGTTFPLTVADGCLFVMGDNRGVSRDSRDPVIGQVDKREVLGKAIYLMIPGTDGGRQPQDRSRMGAIQ